MSFWDQTFKQEFASMITDIYDRNGNEHNDFDGSPLFLSNKRISINNRRKLKPSVGFVETKQKTERP